MNQIKINNETSQSFYDSVSQSKDFSSISSWGDLQNKPIAKNENQQEPKNETKSTKILNENLFENRGFRSNKEEFEKTLLKTQSDFSVDTSKFSYNSQLDNFDKLNSSTFSTTGYDVKRLGSRVNTRRYRRFFQNDPVAEITNSLSKLKTEENVLKRSIKLPKPIKTPAKGYAQREVTKLQVLSMSKNPKTYKLN